MCPTHEKRVEKRGQCSTERPGGQRVRTEQPCSLPLVAVVCCFYVGFNPRAHSGLDAGASSEVTESGGRRGGLMNVLFLRCKNNNNQFYINLPSTKRLETTRTIPKVQGGTPVWVMRAVTFHEIRSRCDLPLGLMQPFYLFPITLQSVSTLPGFL